ncbi:MAG: S8 family peptidase [Thiolinea sp.]
MAAINGNGYGRQLLKTLLVLSAALLLQSTLLRAQTDANTSADTGSNQLDSVTSPGSATVISSCHSIKDSGVPVWPVNTKDTLIADSVITSPYSNRRGFTGSRFTARTEQNVELVWTTIETASGLASMRIETSANEKAHAQWVLDKNCRLLRHQRIVYKQNGLADEIQTLHPTTAEVVRTDALNPPLPAIRKVTADNKRIRVGMVDSGVNYTLPQITARLARTQDGELIGYDFWDNDHLPFDVHYSTSPFRIARHGTGTASLLLREAPFIDLVPYRYPRPDMSRMQELIEHAANNQVHIIGLPLGSNDAEQWTSFTSAAKQHPDILFIASAGNNGRNIDKQPVYPASLDIDNLLVVTSSDDFIVPAERVNWGPNTVDYMLPAEEQPIINFHGEKTTASGSSYAVPRAVALAARFLRDNPHWRAPELIKEFARRYADDNSKLYVSGGFIADPLAIDNIEVKRVSVPLVRDKVTENANVKRRYKLPLNVYVLDEGWPQELVNSSLLEAEAILAQCNIAFDPVTINELSVPAYLRDLDAGTSRTLISALNKPNESKPINVFFARDTRMLTPFDGEAFGRANTRRRPWLQDSVWLMDGIEDAGIALAHELYHVLANSGAHNQIAGNLMQARTSEGSTVLEPMQCEAAIHTAKENRLLFD